MYFIRTGQFEVQIKSTFDTGVNSQPNVQITNLYDGDHFGEIGLVYNTMRTARVMSKNYGSLARLDKNDWGEIERHFSNPKMETAFKEYTFKYKDELRTFIEMEANKIFYFRNLSMITKQELLYGMVRNKYEEGQHLFQQGHEIDRMIIIQSGVVELSIAYDKRVPNEEFIIERLGAGAILNHQSFVIKDIADTDFIAKTPVSCFELTYDRLKQVMKRRDDMMRAK